MAKIPGGITSRPSGQLGNIIFGAARTPEGKVATAREAVKPSNPDTPAQQAQRSKFQQAVAVVQAIGPSIYQEDWNRAVGQLPGFQSWQSILLNNIDGSNVLQPPSDRPLGNLHFPDSFTLATGASSGELDVSWSTENGPNGTAGDGIVIIGIEAPNPGGGSNRTVVTDLSNVRSDGSATLTGLGSATLTTVCLYVRGAGSADGTLSLASFEQGTAAS